MEVPLMCSGTAVPRSSVPLSPAPFRCLVQPFRAPGEITVPRVHWVVIMLPVFPVWPSLILKGVIVKICALILDFVGLL